MKEYKNLASFGALLKSLLNYKAGIVIIFLLQIAWIAFELIIPFLTKALVDEGVNNQDYGFIRIVLLAQLMLFISTLTTEYFKAWMLP